MELLSLLSNTRQTVIRKQNTKIVNKLDELLGGRTQHENWTRIFHSSFYTYK